MRVAFVGLLAGLSLATAAPVPKDFKDKTTDKERILGSWQPFPAGGGAWEFFADGTAKLPNRAANEPPILYTIDPQGTPKAFTWKPSWGSWKGVYDLNGDELRIAIVSGNGPVPTEARPGNGYEFYEFRRVK